MTFFPGVVALHLLSVEQMPITFSQPFRPEVRASEDSNCALLFAALLRIRESSRNTVQFVCRMYTFSLLIII